MDAETALQEGDEAVSQEVISLPHAKATYNYKAQQLEIPGFSSEAAYEVTDGALPNGMLLDAGGSLWGMPAAEASEIYTFTVTATEGDRSAQAVYRLYVEGVLTITPPVGTVFTLNAGEPFEQEFSISGGFSNELLMFSETDLGDLLPEGLAISFNEAFHAVISGTPAQGSQGVYDVYIKVDEVFAGSPVWSYALFRFEVN